MLELLSLGQETEEARSYSDLESDDISSQNVSSTDGSTYLTPTRSVSSPEAEQPQIFDAWNYFREWPKGPPRELDFRVSDLDLLHHYLNHTSKTLSAVSNDAVKKEAWEVKFPRLALQHDSVSYALRALSAMHLLLEKLRSGNCCIGDSGKGLIGTLQSQAESQYGQALRILGADVASFDSTKTNATLATSSLLFVFNTAHEACDIQQKACQGKGHAGENVHENAYDSDNSRPSRLPSWLHFVIGIKMIQKQPIRKTKADGDLDGFLGDDGVVAVPEDVAHLEETDPIFLARVGALQNSSLYSHRMFQDIAETRLAAFKTLHDLLRNQRSRPKDLDTDCCCDALQLLRNRTDLIFNLKASSINSPSATRLFNRNPGRTIFGCIGIMDDKFFYLLEAGDIRALAVYVHFLTFLLVMDDIWYVGDMGRGEIERKARELHQHEQRQKLNVHDPTLQIKFDWRTAMLWPSKMAMLSKQPGH